WRNRKQAAVLLLMAAGSTCIAADIDNALDKGVQRAKTAQQSQARIESIDNATRDKEREFRAVTKEHAALQVYIEQLNKPLAMQQQELNDIENSIRQVTLIERQITPLMLRMIDSIEGFVQADLPFQKDERMARVENLKNLMGRSDVTVAEKYRKVMEAYQKE